MSTLPKYVRLLGVPTARAIADQLCGALTGPALSIDKRLSYGVAVVRIVPLYLSELFIAPYRFESRRDPGNCRL